MLYLKLVRVFTKPDNKWWLFLLFGWGKVIKLDWGLCELNENLSLMAGIPLPLVAIGLGALHEEYGVKDITGNFQ